MWPWLQLAATQIKLNANETGLPNSTPTISAGITNIVQILLGIVGGVAVIFIIVGAIQLATSAGSPQRIKQGRETVIYAVIGVALAIAAYAIVSFIGSNL